MSGELEEDQQRRYNAMLQKINSHNGNNYVQAEESLSTQQFYRGHTTVCGPSSRTVTSTYAPSESSVFKLPNTVQGHSNWARIEGAVYAFVNSYRNSDIGRVYQKLWVRASLEILLAAHNNSQITNEDQILETVFQRLKEKFYGGRKRVPKAYLTSGPQSECSQFDSCGSIASLSTVLNENRENRDVTTSHFPNPAGPSNPYISMDRLTTRQMQNPAGTSNPYIAMDRSTTHHVQNQAGTSNPYVAMDRSTTHQVQNQAGPSYTAMNRSTASQPRNLADQTNIFSSSKDRNATLQSQNQGGSKGGKKNWPLKSPNRVLKGDRAFLAAVKNTNQSSINVSKNDTLSNDKKMTRFGRQIRSPNQFWKGIEKVMNEPSNIIYSRSKNSPQTTSSPEDLNETLMLRNNKLIVKNTPLPNNKKPFKNNLSTVEEQKNKPNGKEKKEPKRKPAGRKPTKKDNKENLLNHSKEKQAPKKASSKVVKKPSVKRKSKGADMTVPKRTKIKDKPEVSDHSLDSESDELFEPLFGRKRTKPVTQVLSPSIGLHSVKKALAVSYSKETPPAKLISQLMEPEVAPTSVAKGAPEATASQVVKRVTKIVEKKDTKKPAKKPVTKSSKNEDPSVEKIMNDVIGKSVYTSGTPACKTTLTVFRATEVESDEESMSDGDDDMYEDML